MKKIFLLLLILSIIPLSACSMAAKCDVDKYKTTVEPLAKKWDDAVALAQQTPRASLAAQISELQAIKRDTEAAPVDACMQEAHGELVKAMQAGIDGFLAFLGQADDSQVTAHFQNSDTHMQQWEKMLAAAASK